MTNTGPVGKNAGRVGGEPCGQRAQPVMAMQHMGNAVGSARALATRSINCRRLAVIRAKVRGTKGPPASCLSPGLRSV